MNFFCFNIILLPFLPLNCQVKLDIYYNPDDCKNCNNVLNSIKDLSTDVNKFFYITKDSENIIEEVFQNMGFDQKKYKINYLPNNFFQCKRKDCISPVLSSYCLFSEGSIKADSFLLKNLPGRISYLNSISEREKDKSSNGGKPLNNLLNSSQNIVSSGNQSNHLSIDIPDSIKISNRCKLFVRDSIINIYDFQLNKNVTLFLNQDFTFIKKIIVIKMRGINPQIFLRSECLDTAFYKNTYAIISRTGHHVPSVGSVFVSDSTINLLLSLTYPRYPDPNTYDSLRLNNKNSKFSINDTILDMKYFVYTRNFSTNKTRLHCINKISYARDEYWILSLPFIFEKDKLFASIHSWNNPADANFLGEFELTNNRFEYKGLRSNDNKNIKIENLRKNQILQRDVNSNFYFTTSLPFVFDYKRNKDFLFDKNEFNINEEIFINDVIGDKDKLYFIVSENGQFFKYTLNTKTKKREGKTAIQLDMPDGPKELKFLDINKYLFLNGNKLYIISK